jgi:toxin ParE1/3/4
VIKKSVVLRSLARRDIDDAISRYLTEAGTDIAFSFIDSLEQAFDHLSGNPGTGSMRYGYELDLPNLRSWPLRKFPFLVFYVERADHIDVWRLLHAARDIPAWIQQSDG